MANSPATIAALERAIYLLDRGHAGPEPVRRFRAAIEVVADLSPDALAELVSTGQAQRDGIDGDAAEVIAAALNDVPCTYLARLERDTRIADAAGRDLADHLVSDGGVRTTWSDGGASVAEMAAAAETRGHHHLMLAEPAHQLSTSQLQSQLAEIDITNMGLAPFQVLSGSEIDLGQDFATFPYQLLASLDIVTACADVTTWNQAESGDRDLTGSLVDAIASPHVDIISIRTCRGIDGSGRPEAPSSLPFDGEKVFAAMNRFDKALEIRVQPPPLDIRRAASGSPNRSEPEPAAPDSVDGQVLSLALAWGTKFAIHSGAGAPAQLEWQMLGCDLAAAHGIDGDRVINCWGLDQLLGWAQNHPS